MARHRVSLFDVHGSLSALCYAIQKALDPIICEVTAEWRNSTYLSVRIECYSKRKQLVIDRLMHGVLVEDYDYRFKLAYSTMKEEPDDWIFITAYPDIHHDDRRVKAQRETA